MDFRPAISVEDLSVHVMPIAIHIVYIYGENITDIASCDQIICFSHISPCKIEFLLLFA